MKLISLIFLFPAWIVFLFSWLSSRSRDIIVFGVHTNSFSGNVKKLFLEDDGRYSKIFISNNGELVRKLKRDGYQAHFKLSTRGVYYCLKAGSYVYSSYPSDINFWLSGGAKYINVWHGTPIKKIERDVSKGYYSRRNKYSWLYWIAAPYLLAKPNSLLVSSGYEEDCFKSAFDVDDEALVRAFPPRLEALYIDSGTTAEEYKVLYVPTWRDDHSFIFANYVDLESFNSFLKKHRITFYIKHHPSDKSVETNVSFSQIITIGKNEDVYDFLKEADVVVSDYSSLIFDSLYLSKPVVLFCPDHESYQEVSREFYIDPCSDLPVKVSYSQAELEVRVLSSVIEGEFNLDKLVTFRHYPLQETLLKQLVERAHQ